MSIQLVLLPDGVWIFVCPDEATRAAIIEAYRPLMSPDHELPGHVLLIVSGSPMTVDDFRVVA